MVLLNDSTPSSGVRALVIGIGAYPKVAAYGLKNLGSPAHSAVEFASWLIEEHNYPDGKPLKYLTLMVSPSPSMPLVRKSSSTRVRVFDQSWDFESCTKSKIAEAIREWAKEVDKSKDDVGVLYFCGHGIAFKEPDIVNGAREALLAEDFDADTHNFADGSIDLFRLHSAVGSLKATNYYFFIDACRSTPSKLIGVKPPSSPDGVLPAVLYKIHRGDDPIFLATRLGENAYGADDKMSEFTDALLRSLRGAGARAGSDGLWQSWVVTSLDCTKV